jgi:GNAT superfamily N-acetyltransferase
VSLLAPTPRAKVPWEIKLELFSGQSGIMPRITQIVGKAAAEGDPDGDLKSLQNYLAGGEAMIVHARTGRTLVGFLVLDASKGAAPFSWVDERYRNRGLGERFYSFACINLAQPTPEFRFHKDMLGEYGYVLRSTGARPVLRDSFYVVHEHLPEIAVEANQNQPRPSTPQAGESGKRPGPRHLVIDDGEWVGYSHHDARRLKLSVRRLPRLVDPGAR